MRNSLCVCVCVCVRARARVHAAWAGGAAKPYILTLKRSPLNTDPLRHERERHALLKGGIRQSPSSPCCAQHVCVCVSVCLPVCLPVCPCVCVCVCVCVVFAKTNTHTRIHAYNQLLPCIQPTHTTHTRTRTHAHTHTTHSYTHALRPFGNTCVG